jgi:hypothetical protein
MLSAHSSTPQSTIEKMATGMLDPVLCQALDSGERAGGCHPVVSNSFTDMVYSVSTLGEEGLI